MDLLVEETKAQLARIFETPGPVYLAFSGGKESALLLHLCDEYRGRFKLLWANTGFTFPHVEAYMRDEYPRLAEVVMLGVRRIHAATASALRAQQEALEHYRNPRFPIAKVVQQRTVEVGDCGIAAVATALGRSYEEIASALGFPCDAAGLPSLPAGRGIHSAELPAALYPLGFMASVLVTNTSPDVQPWMRLPSSDDVKTMIQGQTAILIIHDEEEGRDHALAWRNNIVLDCRADDPQHLHISDLELRGAVIFSPVLTELVAA